MQLLGVSVVAKKLGCSVSTVYRLIGAGEVTCFRVGPKKCYQVEAESVTRFMERRREREEIEA